MNILDNGIFMAPGKELDQYAKARGLCRLCGQTQTHKRVGRFLKKLRNGWEPITVKGKDGSYLVYKGYCIQPTCYSLDRAKRELGEKSQRQFPDDASLTNSLATYGTKNGRTYSMASRPPAHPCSPFNAGKRKENEASTLSLTSASNLSDDDSYRQYSIVSGLTAQTGAQVPASIDASGPGYRAPVLPVKQILDTYVEDPDESVLNLSNVELFEQNIASVLTALRNKKLSTGKVSLDMLMADKCKLGGNRLVKLFEGLLEEGIEVRKLCLRNNSLEKLTGLTNFLRSSTHLTELNLSKNQLKDDGVTVLINAISRNARTRLSKLNLSRNQIWSLSESSRTFFASNQTLTTLNLENNFLRDASVGMLATCISNNENTVLEKLYLGNNAIGKFGAEALSGMLRQNSVLTTLGLTGNEIGDEGAKLLLGALETNGTLQEISGLYANHIANQNLIHDIEKALELRLQNSMSRAFSIPTSPASARVVRMDASINEIAFSPSSQHLWKSNHKSDTPPSEQADDSSNTLSSSSGIDDFDADDISDSTSSSCDDEDGVESLLPFSNIHMATTAASGFVKASNYRGAMEALDLATPSQHTRLVEGSESGLGDLKTFCLRANGTEEVGFEAIAFTDTNGKLASSVQDGPLVEVFETGVEVSMSPPRNGNDGIPTTRFALEKEIVACKEALSTSDTIEDRTSKKDRIALRKRLLKLIPLRKTLPSRQELEQRIAEIDMTLSSKRRVGNQDMKRKLEEEKRKLQNSLQAEIAEESGTATITAPPMSSFAGIGSEVKQRVAPTPAGRRALPSNPVDRLTLFHAAPLSYVDQNSNERHVLPLLDFDYESRVLQQALKDAERIGARIEVEHEIATTDRLSAFFAQGGRRLLHLSCHGHPDWLALENGFGDMQPLFVEDLKSFIAAGGSKLDFVFISACHSLPAGKAFLEAGVPHVVCARQDAKFRDEACAEFARCFYRALACNKTLQQAFNMAKEAVRVSPLVKDAKIESSKFLLLPDKGPQSSYHDVDVFFADDRPTKGLSGSQSPPTRILQRVPTTFIGREEEMYRILEALRCTDLVQVTGSKGSGKATLIAAVAKYIEQRRKSFMLDEILWMPNDAVEDHDSLAKLVEKAMSLLSSAKGSVKSLGSYREIRSKVLQGMHGKRLLLVVDARDMTSSVAIRNLEQFLKDLLHACSIKILLVGDTNLKAARVPFRTIEIGPLDFETSAFLFSRLVHSGRFSAPELSKILVPKLHTEYPYPLKRNTLIFEKIGQGIPADIEQASADMTEKDLLELVRIAQRPVPRVTTRAALEEEIQRRLSEEAIALRKKHYLRARDLRDLIDEMQGLRQYLRTVDELSTEVSSLKESLEKATKTRNYDSANNIQKRVESLEKQMEKETRWRKQYHDDQFDRITAKAKNFRQRGGRRASA
eukprot:Nitzschia sp. Nitz4//scaffold224_size33420//23814//28117//NITZ4_007891-RA/size33420-augustus-gene-0.43-mRNA-1//1//CDS//3329542653//8015//frame0